MKKSLIKNTFLILTIIFFSMLFPNQAKAQETTAPTTSEYTLSTDGTPMDATMNADSKTTVVFSFKVDNVSKLEINLSAKQTGYAGNIDYVKAGVFEDKLGAKCIYKGNYTGIEENTPVKLTTNLEPGTYYIIFIRNTTYSSTHTTGTVTASVTTLKEIKDERPITFEKSLTLTPDSTYNSVITSNGSRQLYFKFKLTNKGTVHLFTSAESVYPDIKQLPYKVSILNKDEIVKASNELTGVNTVEESKFKLAKGTYYICISYSKTYYVGDISVKARITYKK